MILHEDPDLDRRPGESKVLHDGLLFDEVEDGLSHAVLELVDVVLDGQVHLDEVGLKVYSCLLDGLIDVTPMLVVLG